MKPSSRGFVLVGFATSGMEKTQGGSSLRQLEFWVKGKEDVK